MGQKVHPTGIRLGIVKDHTSIWYAESKNYAKQLITDLQTRAYIEKALDHASVSRIVIERPAQTARITIHTARPGIIIGKKGEDVDKLRKDLTQRMGVPVHINIEDWWETGWSRNCAFRMVSGRSRAFAHVTSGYRLCHV